MKRRKQILALLAIAVVLTVAAVVLAPSTAKAQHLVEYDICLLAAQDTEVPVDDPDDKAALAELFGLEEWPGNYGAIGTCLPKFHKATHEFTKIKVCFSAYEDVDGSGNLSPFDTEQHRLCETVKFER